MRTTVTLDPDVVELLQQAMAARRQSFKEALNTAVRRGLADVEVGPAEPPFEWQPRAMGLRSGIDPARFNALVDDLEADAIAEAMANAMANAGGSAVADPAPGAGQRRRTGPASG
jgi:hypothetical protein